MQAVNIVKNLFTTMQKQYRMGIIKKSYAEYTRYIEMRGVKIKQLTPEQKRQVDAVYKKYGYKYTYRTHVLHQAVTGNFDPNIFPEDLFRVTVEYGLNNQDMRAGWSDKNYFERILPGVPFPECIVKNINGVFYDSNFNVISKDNAVEIVSSQDEYVIKPSVDTGFGKAVRHCLKSDDVVGVFKEYKKDFVIQKVIKQHEVFSALNKSSINVMRYISLYIDGKVYPVSATIRVGSEGSFTDIVNTKNGRGTLIIGIDENGCMRDKAYFQNGEHVEIMPNGYDFKNVKIPAWDKINQIIAENHKYMGHFGFIGWDITVDENENPIVIEYNVKGPGVLYYQYANGPLLGKYTDMVMDYIKNKN